MRGQPEFESGSAYYALQVTTGAEQRYIRIFEASHPESAVRLYFLQKQTRYRIGGVCKKPVLEPAFKGYVFAKFPNAAGEKAVVQGLCDLRATCGFYRVLPDIYHPAPLKDRDLACVVSLVTHSENSVMQIPKVVFTEGGQIAVTEGPFKGLEALIRKVDRKTQKILAVFDNGFSTWLSYDEAAKAK